MKQNETKKSPKIPKYYCEYCDYTTSNKKDYSKHNLTTKHQAEINMKQFETKNPQIFECNCGDFFNSRTSLWRHKKKCLLDVANEISKTNEIQELKEFMKYLMKENTDMKSMMMEVIKNGTTNTNITHTNSHNKAFNLNFFLNETCKDAMNIMDFVESIQLQVSDLEAVGELGYVEGISNIIVKNLKDLDVTQRPVHCTDKKRETMYVKDADKWEKDEHTSILSKVITPLHI